MPPTRTSRKIPVAVSKCARRISSRSHFNSEFDMHGYTPRAIPLESGHDALTHKLPPGGGGAILYLSAVARSLVQIAECRTVSLVVGVRPTDRRHSRGRRCSKYSKCEITRLCAVPSAPSAMPVAQQRNRANSLLTPLECFCHSDSLVATPIASIKARAGNGLRRNAMHPDSMASK
jgi:hypothetical protein